MSLSRASLSMARRPAPRFPAFRMSARYLVSSESTIPSSTASFSRYGWLVSVIHMRSMRDRIFLRSSAVRASRAHFAIFSTHRWAWV